MIVYFATDDNGYVKPSFSDTAEDGHVPFNMDDVEAREVTVRIAGGEKIRIVDGVMVTDHDATFNIAKEKAIANNAGIARDEKAANFSACLRILKEICLELSPSPKPPELQALFDQLEDAAAGVDARAAEHALAISAASDITELNDLEKPEYTPAIIADKR